MGPDRFPLERAGHLHDLVRRDAEMVRPEPDQPLDEADIGAKRGIEARLGFVLKELLRQRRRWRRSWFRYWRWRLLLVCGVVRIRRHAWLARGFAAIDKVRGIRRLGLLLRTQRELLLRCLFGAKVKDLARRFATRRQIGGDEAGLRTLQIGEEGALRVRSDGGDRIARRAETEPVERKRRCFFFATRGHDKSSRGETCRWLLMRRFFCGKSYIRKWRNRRCFLTFCSRAGHDTAAKQRLAARQSGS